MNPYRVRSDLQSYIQELCPYAFATFIIYLAGHGFGLLNAGLNVDDWNQVEVPPEWGNQGRWALWLYYKYVLISSFTESFQITAAFIFFALAAYLIAKQIAGPKPFLLFVAVFALGVSHPYWVDALNFSAQVSSGPLSFLLAIVAFQFVLVRTMHPAHLALCVLCGGTLLAVSLSLYQPYGLLGLLVPGIAVMSIGSVDARLLLKIITMSLAVLLLGCMLYVAHYHLYFYLFPTASEDMRAGYSGVHDLAEKVQIFPGLFRQALGARLFGYEAFSALQDALVALGAVLVGMNVIALLYQRQWLDALRLPFGFVGLLLAPFAAWFAIKAGYPPRALAPLSFVLSAAIFSIPLAPLAVLLQRLRARQAALPGIVLSLAALAAAAGLIVSSAAWHKQFMAYERDKALAGLIAAAYASLAEPGDALVLVGSRDYPSLHLGDSVGRSAFDPVWSRADVLRRLFDDPYLSPKLVEASAFAHGCTAFPKPDSVVKTEGAVNICLSEVAAPH
jgi:Glucosyl transferase GtrII